MKNIFAIFIAAFLINCSNNFLDNGQYDVALVFTKDTSNNPYDIVGTDQIATWDIVKLDENNWKLSIPWSNYVFDGEKIDSQTLVFKKESEKSHCNRGFSKTFIIIFPNSDSISFTGMAVTTMTMPNCDIIILEAEAKGNKR